MINQQLLNPSSIVVVGGSDDVTKPGGKVLKNIIDGNFNGDLYVVNPKMDLIQGIQSFRDINDLHRSTWRYLQCPQSFVLMSFVY